MELLPLYDCLLWPLGSGDALFGVHELIPSDQELPHLHGENLTDLRRDIEAVSIDDRQTLDEVKHTYEKTGYILDPHTAVGVAAARKVRGFLRTNIPDFIVLATAHPAKFGSILEPLLGLKLPLPPALAAILERPKKSVGLPAEYEKLKNLLSRSPNA